MAVRKAQLAGNIIGNVTVLSEYGQRRGAVLWKCRCKCNNTVIATSGDLLRGRPKSCGCMSIKPNNFAIINTRYRKYRSNAKVRGIPFNISFEEFSEITSKDCKYCGEPPQPVSDPNLPSKYNMNGVDRVNSDLGYEINNVVPCCKHCNKAKMRLSLGEFRNLISKIYKNYVMKPVWLKFTTKGRPLTVNPATISSLLVEEGKNGRKYVLIEGLPVDQDWETVLEAICGPVYGTLSTEKSPS